jgi:hypothetical protein
MQRRRASSRRYKTGTCKLREKNLTTKHRSPKLAGDWLKVHNPTQKNYLSLNPKKRERKARVHTGLSSRWWWDSKGFWGWCITLRITGILGLFQRPSSEILKTRKHNVSETGFSSACRWRRETPTLLGPLERANLNHWSGLRFSLFSPEDGNRFCFLNVLFSSCYNTWRWKK